MEPPRANRSRPWAAATLLQRVEGPGKDDWRSEELADIFRDQLAANPKFPADARRTAEEVHASPNNNETLEFNTFAELLNHATPPLSLLKLTKQFARDSAKDGSLPCSVAMVLYYAAIAIALMRHGRLVTQLGPDKVQFGFKWALNQAWVDPKTRAIFQEATVILNSRGMVLASDNID